MKEKEDICAFVKLFFVLCVVLLHIRGFYVNRFLERLFSIPFTGEVMLASFVNQIFYTLSGYYLSKKYRHVHDHNKIPGAVSRDFLIRHYRKLFKLSFLTLPVGLWFHIHYYKADVNLFECFLDLFLLRTGYGIGSGNPYNQPLWFIDVLYIMYVYFAAVCICMKKYSNIIVSAVLLVCAAGMHGGINITLPDTRVLYALFAFSSGIIMYQFEVMRKKIRLSNAVSAGLCFMILFLFIFELLGYESYHQVYSAADMWIVVQIFFWNPVAWIASHIQIQGITMKKISESVRKISMSIYIWHYPLIYITLGLLNRINIQSSQTLYTLIQILMIAGFSTFSAYIIEPGLSRTAGWAIGKISGNPKGAGTLCRK